MRAFAAAGLLLLTCAGCSSTCADGNRGILWFSRTYHSCDMECCPKDPDAEKKECRCSASCPCWKRHR